MTLHSIVLVIRTFADLKSNGKTLSCSKFNIKYHAKRLFLILTLITNNTPIIRREILHLTISHSYTDHTSFILYHARMNCTFTNTAIPTVNPCANDFGEGINTSSWTIH